MIHVFVDTNIFIDLIADRKPFSKFAIEIFNQAELNKLQLYTSSHTIATSHYLLKKFLEEKPLRVLLYNLLGYVTIISIDALIIKKSLKSHYKDFEDAIQIIAAHSIPKINYIVTRNTKDFKGCEMDVLAPEALCKLV